MSSKLTIEEKYSRYWPTIAVLSLILSVVFFVSYRFIIEDVLWMGYLRLAAFGFFAIGLLSLFKLREGQVEITVSVDDDVVESQYKVRDRIVYTDEWPITDLYKLKIDEMPNKSLYNDIIKSDKCIRFRKEDENAWIYFNKLNGRVIPLSSKNAERLYDFLEESVRS